MSSESSRNDIQVQESEFDPSWLDRRERAAAIPRSSAVFGRWLRAWRRFVLRGQFGPVPGAGYGEHGEPDRDPFSPQLSV